jgi:hypothetical protein
MRVLAWVLEGLLLIATYLLFIGEVSRLELAASVVVAALGVVAWNVVWGEGLAAVAADGRLFAQGWRLLGYAFSGTWEILLVLARHLAGKPAESLFQVTPFDPGGDDPHSATRRALAVGYTSITPNFIVVDVDRKEGRMLYHQIEKSEVLEMTRRLGAK